MIRGRATPTSPESHAGVVFPLTDGERSTQPVGRAVVSSATARVDTAASEAAQDETRWYSHYPRHFRELTRLGAGVNAGLIAADGLTALHNAMRFRRQGAEISIHDAIAVPRSNYFASVTVEGTGQVSEAGLVLYDEEQPVRASELMRLLDQWDANGVAEPTATEALRAVHKHSDWLDLRDTTVVVLGAAAEMGPLEALLSWGCHVVAIDLPGRAQWRSLIDMARRSPGRLTLPVRRNAGATTSDAVLATVAGADVVTEAPEITEWLLRMEQPFIVGDYVYAPGSMHVRTSTAVDGIISTILERRPDVGVAYLATPTDCYAVPGDAVDASLRGFQGTSRIVATARGLGGKRVFRANFERTYVLATGRRFGVFDGLITQQGANYALAKRVQQWRAQRARDQGAWVSINVAPPTRTKSVMNSRVLEAAYGGSHRFGLQVFTPQASRQVMAALLVHDLKNEQSLAQPHLPIEDAMDLLASEAMHGGMWRAPYAPRSVLGFAVATGRFRRR
ncbi:MAG: hypothetical protein ACJ72Y_10320 [Actinomycetes bacterium]